MGDSYALIFLNSALAKGDAIAPLSLLFLFMARMLPIIAQAPFFGAKVLPHPVKIVFSLCMFVIFLPHLLAVTTEPITFNPYLVLLFMKEFFIGLLMGYIISMPFAVVQSAGIFIDHQRGGASLMVNDPTIQNQSSPLGTLFNYVLIYMFFVIDGPFMILDSISQSYTVIPPNQFFNPQFFNENTPFWTMQVQLFNKVMVLSIQLATPALLAILMTDVFLGIANRLAPQVQITFLGMPLKSLLALVIVCLGFTVFNSEVLKQTQAWVTQLNQMIEMFNPW
ncbi:MAG: flagellar biosynthetic protein FliR [Parachlamydiaceae bacterium]|nr:flagellar biosynthetic protein FliR [Parachlamydiaceae bacterium]